MEFEEAVKILSDAERYELRDHAFGDCEVSWYKDKTEVGGGYFGGGNSNVWVLGGGTSHAFDGNEARTLRECGKLIVSRNDSTGPDDFVEGRIMPGLTLEGVRKELEG